MSEERITNLEIKFLHQEDFIDQLNQIVTQQQQQIERLEKEMLGLRSILEGVGESPQAQKPPHY